MAKSEIEKAYAKQLKRIKQFMRRAEQRGYQFIKNIIPKKPKKIRPESVENLKKITPEKMYKKSVYVGEATYGEIVKGTLGRKFERKAQAQKAAQTRKQAKQREAQTEQRNYYSTPDNISGDSSFFDYMVINEYRRNIAHFGNKAYAELGSWLDNLISEHGEHAVAEMLEDGASSGTVVTYQIAYDDSKLQDYMSDMFNYLEFGDDYRADISDAFDEDSNFDTY